MTINYSAIRKTIRKTTAFIVLASLSIMTLSGCGKKADTSPTTAQAKNATDTTTTAGASTQERKALESVTMLVNYKAVEAPSAENPIILALKEKTGTALNVMWVPQDAFEEKINTMMASSALPEITVIREVKSSGFVNAARAGMFWDLTPYISQYPNLSRLDANVMTNVQTDGKQYLIPRVRDTARMGGLIRTDWLEKLGLEMPATIDELYDILYAFTYNDPDGNGVNDTMGLSMNDSELRNDSTLVSIYNGGPNTWAWDENSGMVSEYDSDIYTDSLTWFRTAYENGLINKDFPINADELTNFTSGKAGMMWLGNLEDATTRMNNLKEINPNAKTDIFQILLSDKDAQPKMYGFRGYTGAIAITKTAVNDEAHLLQVLDFMDKMGEPEICDLFNWGTEGDSYSMADNKVTQTEEQAGVYANKYNQLRQITPFYTFLNLQAKEVTPLAAKVRELMNTNTQYTVFDPTLPYISETAVELGDINVYIQDAATKYVIGEIDLDGWKASVKSWKAKGGDKIAAEYTQQYKATH